MLGFWLAYHLRYVVGFPDDVAESDYRPFIGWGLESFLPLLALLASTLPLIFLARGVYRLSRWTGLLDEALLITNSAFLGFGGLIVTVFFVRTLYFSRAIFLYAFVFVVGLLLLWRVCWRAVLCDAGARALGRSGAGRGGRAGGRAGDERADRAAGPRLRAGRFVDDTPCDPNWAIATQRAVVRPQRLGSCYDLPEVVRQRGIDEVIIALPSTAHDQLYWTIEQCRLCASRSRSSRISSS